MDNWVLYDTLLGNGDIKSTGELAAEQAAEIFINGIVNDPAYQEDAVVNGETTPIVASRNSSIKCSIKAVPGTDIHIGDMVECLDEDWVVAELYIDKVGIISGEMWLCNDTIRFQNHSPSVNTRRCVVDSGAYSKTTDSDAFIMENTYKMYLTIDEATRLLYVDKRLSLGRIYSSSGDLILEAYKIIGMDLKSKNFGEGSHLMVLTLQRDVYNPEADSYEDNLCDVYRENESIMTPATKGSCAISGRDSIRIGTTRKYTVVYNNVLGEQMNDIASEWNITAPAAVKYTISDNACIIDIPLDETIVGEEIMISVSDVSGAYGVCEKKVQVVTVG